MSYMLTCNRKPCRTTFTSPTLRDTTPKWPLSTWIAYWASAEPLPSSGDTSTWPPTSTNWPSPTCSRPSSSARPATCAFTASAAITATRATPFAALRTWSSRAWRPFCPPNRWPRERPGDTLGEGRTTNAARPIGRRTTNTATSSERSSPITRVAACWTWWTWPCSTFSWATWTGITTRRLKYVTVLIIIIEIRF